MRRFAPQQKNIFYARNISISQNHDIVNIYFLKLQIFLILHLQPLALMIYWIHQTKGVDIQ